MTPQSMTTPTPLTVGVDPRGLPYVFTPIADPPTNPFEDGVLGKEERLRAVAADWVREEYGSDDHPKGDYFSWREHGHRVPFDILKRVFTWDEIVRIWLAQVLASDVSREIEEKHPILEKVRHSMWHFGLVRNNFNAFARIVAGLRALRWSGGDVRLVHVSKYRGDGWVENWPHPVKDLWIDNDFGLLVYMDDKHVLTVGFGAGAEGVFISQVQLREKKGNRWLFKLPAHYLDVALDVFTQAFEMPLWLVEGKSAVSAVRRSYGSGPCSITDENEKRITALYDRPLANYDREGESVLHEGRLYRKLLKTETTR